MVRQKRVELILVWVLGLVFFSSFISFGYAAEKQREVIHWKLSHFGPPTHFFSRNLVELAREMGEASKGRMIVDVYHAETLGKCADHWDMVREGIADIGLTCAVYNPDHFQLTQFTELPLFSTSARNSIAVVQKLLKKGLITDEFKDNKLVIPFVTSPAQVLSTKKLTKVEDFKGLRISPGGVLWNDVWSLLGAQAVNIRNPDVYLALERGTLDAVALNWSGASSWGWAEVTKYPTEVSIAGGTLCFLSVNKASWNKLPADIQVAWTKIFEEKPVPWSLVYDEYAEKGKEKWTNLGKTITTFPTAERARLGEILRPVWKKWIDRYEAKGKPAKEIYKTYVEVMRELGEKVPVEMSW